MSSAFATDKRGGRVKPFLRSRSALAQDLVVDGDHERLAPGRLRPADQTFGELTITVKESLVPAPLPPRSRKLLDRTRAAVTLDVDRAAFGGGLGRQDFAVRPKHTGAARGPDQNGERELVPEQVKRGRGLTGAGQHARHELDRGQVVLVPPQRALVFRPAIAKVENDPWQTGSCPLPQSADGIATAFQGRAVQCFRLRPPAHLKGGTGIRTVMPSSQGQYNIGGDSAQMMHSPEEMYACSGQGCQSCPTNSATRNRRDGCNGSERGKG